MYSLGLSFIHGLFVIRCPSTVIFEISTLVVFTVKRFIKWSIPHIFHKVQERFTPAWADCNAAPTIIFEVLTTRLMTTGDHRNPTNISFPSLGWPNCLGPISMYSMKCRHNRANPFFVKASTASSQATKDVCGKYDDLRSTVTATTPPCMPVRTWISEFAYSEATKPHPFEIFCLWHYGKWFNTTQPALST